MISDPQVQGSTDRDPTRLLGSVVIAAHNESAVIRRCLESFLDAENIGSVEVLVVCNGCTDGTAETARATGFPIQVIELDVASKVAALAAGDAAARAFPRVYLDADVDLPAQSLRAVLDALSRESGLAARPPLRYDTTNCSALVRSYYRARSRVPSLVGALWGAGIYGLSEQGRRRFGDWPDIGADDLFVDRQFTSGEINIVGADPVVVRVPRNAATLVKILGRNYRGKGEGHTQERVSGNGSGHADADGGVDGATATIGSAKPTLVAAVKGIARTAIRNPVHGVDAAVYVGFAVLGRVVGRRSSRGGRWARDETSRDAS